MWYEFGMHTHALSRLEIRTPRESDRIAFIEARRLSRDLHRPWESTAANRPVPGSDDEFNRLLSRASGTDQMWLGYLKDSSDSCQHLVGQVSVMPISPGPAGSAYIGYWAHVDQAGKGLMREMLALVIHNAFVKRQLWRIEANIVPENERSIRLVQSLGFRYEGTALEYLEIGGSMQDHEHHALLAREWSSLGDDPLERLLSDRR